MANSFTTTFDFAKLKNKLKTIFKDEINVLGSGINNAIQQGIDAGKDIEGSSFASLKDSTIMTGGSKILERSGTMRSTQKFPAEENDLKVEIKMTGKSTRTGKFYGAYHNTGYTNPPGSWYPGKEVPKREWFGISKEMRIGGSEFEKRLVEIKSRIENAWAK